MKLTSTDLALVTARVGCCRIGASRLGFAPYDVRGAGSGYPGEYVWREVKPPATQWSLLTEGVVCGKRPTALFAMSGVASVGGRMLVTDPQWHQNNQGGAWPGWGWTPTATAKSEAMLTAVMPWLSTGKRYLALHTTPQVDGDPFGSNFEAYLISKGGTFTRTGAGGAFNGYDWRNYDVICATHTANAGEDATFDAAIAAGKSALIGVILGSNTLSRYGIARAVFQSWNGVPDYLGYPFDCAPLGLVAHQVVGFQGFKLIAGVNTMGGALTLYPNTLAEDLVGLRTPPTDFAVTFVEGSTPAGEITYWLWDFGDGSTYEGQTPPTHHYYAPGVYTVTLHVASAKGSDTFSDTITAS